MSDTNKSRIHYLLGGCSAEIPHKIAKVLSKHLDTDIDSLYKMSESNMCKHITSVFKGASQLVLPYNTKFCSLADGLSLKNFDKNLAKQLKKNCKAELESLAQTQLAFVSLFLADLKDDPGDYGIMVEPFEYSGAVTLLTPDIIIDYNDNVPIQLLARMTELGYNYELTVEAHYKENSVLNYIQQIDLDQKIFNFKSNLIALRVRADILRNKSKVEILAEYISKFEEELTSEFIEQEEPEEGSNSRESEQSGKVG